MTDLDAWTKHALELKQNIAVLLELQLREYETMTAKLEEWKQNPEGQWLTIEDYEPWQRALRTLEAAQRAYDAHVATKPAEAE